MLAEMNEVIRAGEEMRRLRAEMVAMLAGCGWTQDRIARIAGMSQPAVSKQVLKEQAGPPRPPVGLSLKQSDGPWLEGRLWGLAEALSDAVQGAARCTRAVHLLARGRTRFTPESTDALRRLVEEDLRQYAAELPAGYRAAYDEISRGFDVPDGGGAGGGSAGARRTLAHRLQRDRLGAG